LNQIDDEILDQFYGCGSPIPDDLEGRVVLDLGCGTGRDVYLASKRVGPDGYVIGIDMTPEQLDVARRHVDTQTQRFGYATPNVDFRMGYIEDLRGAGIADHSVDVVISNCVINLSPDKEAVFSEILRVLKPGGELYFADVFADRRIPVEVLDDPILQGECLAGAMYIEDFRRLVQRLGCLDYRVVSESPIEINDPALERRIGMVNFTSKTIRLFKLDSLEDLCEDYGQVAVYQGTIPEAPHRFILDDHHIFETGKPMLVCGNSAAMVQETRFGRHFQILGDRNTHYGAFDCSPSPASDTAAGSCC
jgi:ubiquinone/menaquinone biosynthesis C-methylase UbiE